VIPQPYEVALNRAARRALAESLPLAVAIGVSDFITGPLGENPHRVGGQLSPPLAGMYSAHVMRDWRVLYVIDEEHRAVIVRDIRHRRDAYRAP
jgi:mRNA interferase RelE/StbE